MKESKIEQRHREVAKAWGWFVDKIMKTSLNGFPDRFYASANARHRCRTCNRGRIVLMEWKRPGGGELSAQQNLRIKELRAAGVEVHVVDSVKQANSILGIGHVQDL